MQIKVVLLLLTLSLIFTNAVRIEGKISTGGILSDLRLLRPTTRVTLDGEFKSSLIDANGHFSFDDVDPGTYLLEVQDIDYIFSSLRVDVHKDNEILAYYIGQGTGWDNTGYSVPHPFQLKAKANAEYFLPRQRFNPIGLLKSPMVLMLGFSAVMLVIMPKMMKNMDPEAMKEMQESQADAQKMISGMFSRQ